MNERNEHEEDQWLSSYLDGRLDAAQTKRLDAHMADCSDCREQLESLRYTKRLLASAPRRAMPPELISAIEERLVKPSWTGRFWQGLRTPRVFVPAGALAALALFAGVWYGVRRDSPEQYIPLEPLMTAHARYTAESLVPQGSLVSSTYSAQLTAQYIDVRDQDAE
jgi:predicted anti-sigma-YlaC factor YlaD